MSEALIPILVVATVFGTIFGIVYIVVSSRHRERMTLIDKGLTAEIFNDKKKKKESKQDSIKWGLVLIGLGVGLIAGHLIGQIGFIDKEVAQFSMLMIFGGFGLIIYYLMPSKEQLEQDGFTLGNAKREDEEEPMF